MDARPNAQDALRNHFGFDEFRPLQREIIEHVIGGGDALVLMPTGGGKSLCYQIPGLLREGTAVIVSPLIALMQDQVDALKANGLRAAVLNSTLTPVEQANVQRLYACGELDFLYLAPERLVREDTLVMLEQSRVALFAIDEAHCVSQWGHDFRPEYRQLGVLADRFPGVPRLALTATADPRTRQDILDELRLERARTFASSFDRPNICYRIAAKRNAKQQLLGFLKDRPPGESGIVYCLSRRRVEDLSAWLCDQGYTALPYHAGLPGDVRADNQRRFLAEEGVIVVATIAFGMGIDKPNVRFVAHLDLPKSIEAYYQETGRAGRDGLPADAWMVYGFGEMRTLLEFINGSDADRAQQHVERVKLDAMLGLCETAECRRRQLLRHFGEQRDSDCDNCDNCLEPPETFDGTLQAQQAMSAIYRSGQQFGMAHIVDLLRGETTEKARRFGHHQLAVFGLGEDRSSREWRSVLRQLVALGLVDIDFQRYGALRLAQASRAVLRGETSLKLVSDRKPSRRRRSASSAPRNMLSQDDAALFESLRALRLEIAREEGVPPYVVFGDATLIEMATTRPGDRAALLEVSGVGPHKLERYGGHFLDVIAAQGEAA